MTSVLLDTSALSFLYRTQVTTRNSAATQAQIADRGTVISLQTLAETWLGAEIASWGERRRADLAAFLQDFIVLPLDRPVARAWTYVMTHAQRRGRTLEAADCWIAATAVAYDVPLITFDRDFLELHIEGLAIEYLPFIP
jgi:predicted nucleic acid-binding protein